jgi:hypothetical protein
MSFFTETIAASLQGRVVRAAYLVKLDFTSGPMYVWNGNGPLETPGITWNGLGDLGTLEGLEQAIAGQAPEARIGLSGLNTELLSLALEDFETEVKNRSAIVYMQFFEEATEKPLDEPYAIWAGKMLTPEFTMEETSADIILACESIFLLRSRPNFAMYTDRDQNRRFEDDKGFEFVTGLKAKVVTWPDF